ncbi:MAG: hypothetical protein K2K10_00430, partial [Acetatifactor sp.]|nr:hypothetical protein [Acetatifactor sp.]
MKKRPSLSPRQLLLCAAILLLFTALILFLFGHKKDEKQFTNLTHDLFVEQMTSNTLNMHYTLAFPEDFGIYDYKPVLPGYSANEDRSARLAVDNTLSELSKIRPGKLSPEDAYTYDLLVRKLENSQNLNEFTYYQMP